MIGRILARVRSLPIWHPVLAYHRELLRPSVLKAPPVSVGIGSAEIHVLTSEKDWINTVWALRSFYAQVPERYPLVIHGDASLSQASASTLRRLFPGARVIEQAEIRAQVLDSLAAYPRCKRLRETNVLSIKIFDFAHTLQADRMILFDSDLLFFSRPDAFLAYLEDGAPRVNCYNRDVATAYALDLETIRAHGFAILPEINSGFGLVYRDSLRLDWIEEFLGIPGLPEGHFWRIEQTLFALCGSRFGAELLPDEYRVFLEGPVGNRPYRHYVGAIRDQMYSEGMRKLKRSLLSAH